MPLKQNVLDAFTTLGLTPDADITEATKAYKRLALQHHPDRNHGDSTATQRFQQVPFSPHKPSPLFFSQRQTHRSALPGISARGTTRIQPGATSQTIQPRRLALAQTMTFPWMRKTSMTFTCMPRVFRTL